MWGIMKKLWVALILTLASQIATAGKFNWNIEGGGFKGSDLNGRIEDLVSSKFTNRYPNDNWTIYIFASTASGSPAINFASVGVARKGKQGMMPANRIFNSYAFNSSFDNASLREKKPWLIDGIRNALTAMMDECEKTPNCNID
jgi:hypothetical protein